jgi:hypothetical protein
LGDEAGGDECAAAGGSAAAFKVAAPMLFELLSGVSMVHVAFLTIAGDERHRRTTIEQGHGGFDLLLANAERFRYLPGMVVTTRAPPAAAGESQNRLRFPTGTSYERSTIDSSTLATHAGGLATAGMYTHLQSISRGHLSCPNPKDAKSRKKLRHHHSRVQRHRLPRRHRRHHHLRHPLHQAFQSNRQCSDLTPFFRGQWEK